MFGFIKQGIASTQFFLWGKKHFTQTGYRQNIKSYTGPVQPQAVVALNDPRNDGADLEGKTLIVTGSNQGLGKEIALYAASKQANVYLLCRNQERAEAARDDIKQQTKNENVNVLLADVSEPTQIKRVVADFQAREGKLDCLVCNAGALFNERRTNSDGDEITLMAHLVGGSYLLTKLLMPELERADDPRVIYVASGGMYNTKYPSWEEAASSGKFESKYNGNMAYAYAKRGQVLLAERLASQYPGIKFVSCHPGWTKTEGVDAAYGSQASILEPMRTLWEGSEGICWLATSPSTDLEGGAFYLDRKPQRKHIAGPFFTDGTYTRNTDTEVDDIDRKRVV